MPENIFKQISSDILKLHQQTAHLFIAMQSGKQPVIEKTEYVTFDGKYYMLTPQNLPEQQAIVLIEAEQEQTRLSWITTNKILSRQDNRYNNVVHSLQRRIKQTKKNLQQSVDMHLLELTPQLGRLMLDTERDFTLSPSDLVKALYPADNQIKHLAG
ncbi:TPA: hypothetical protein ACFP4Q_000111 [Neisseria weaveri]|uniref:Putative lipoprotein n=1 Tax=Neisseria weaveri TaxID=28091 RepID=A0A448VK74_9NEIS|nr:hypothetical protein [Neisseria weaveri]EGV38591.1 hypothetical protein l11_03930 [Neisseria weaveri LMG 5135]SAY51277.1 putative lipoprotein [Neisseria weaveri]VEJ50155.1 putative lipoprotein [Neisseria weaveri]